MINKWISLNFLMETQSRDFVFKKLLSSKWNSQDSKYAEAFLFENHVPNYVKLNVYDFKFEKYNFNTLGTSSFSNPSSRPSVVEKVLNEKFNSTTTFEQKPNVKPENNSNDQFIQKSIEQSKQSIDEKNVNSLKRDLKQDIEQNNVNQEKPNLDNSFVNEIENPNSKVETFNSNQIEENKTQHSKTSSNPIREELSKVFQIKKNQNTQVYDDNTVEISVETQLFDKEKTAEEELNFLKAELLTDEDKKREHQDKLDFINNNKKAHFDSSKEILDKVFEKKFNNVSDQINKNSSELKEAQSKIDEISFKKNQNIKNENKTGTTYDYDQNFFKFNYNK